MVMFLLLYLSFDERTCLSVEVRVSQGNVENFKHFTAKKESGYLGVYFIEVLHCVFPWQSQKLMNYILPEKEILFTKYRIPQTQALLIRVFSNTKKILRSSQIKITYVY